MQTGRVFHRRREHAARRVRSSAICAGGKTDLPAFVVLPQTMGRGGGNLPNGQDGGFLGKAHDPFSLMADPSQPNFKVPDLLPPAEIDAARLERRRKLREIVDATVKDFEASENAKLMDENFQAAFRLMTSTQGPRGVRSVEGAGGSPRALRHEPLRPVLPARAAAGRGGRAVRHDQHVPHRVRRDHLGHPRHEAVHVDRGHEEHRRADVRPGVQRADRRPRSARHAGRDAGVQPGRVRPHAAREPGRRARPLAAVLYVLLRRRRRARAAASSAAATRSAPCRPSGPSSRPTSWPRSSTAWASTSKHRCRARPAGRSRWSTSGTTRFTNCFERACDEAIRVNFGPLLRRSGRRHVHMRAARARRNSCADSRRDRRLAARMRVSSCLVESVVDRSLYRRQNGAGRVRDERSGSRDGR